METLPSRQRVFPQFLSIDWNFPVKDEYSDMKWLGEGSNAIIVSLIVRRLESVIPGPLVLRIPKPLHAQNVVETLCRDVETCVLDIPNVSRTEFVIQIHHNHLRYIIDHVEGCPRKPKEIKLNTIK